MRFSKVLHREKLREDYIAAFASANPTTKPTEVPQLSYENGWWIFRYPASTSIAARYREKAIIAITSALWARANTV